MNSEQTGNLHSTRERRWDLVFLALVVIVFLVLGTVYSVTVPLWETPDEMHHFFFVKHLADGKGLPIQSEETRGLWEQEGSQPPLYYVLGAALTFWIDTSDAESLVWINPQGNRGTPADLGNKNAYIHTEREAWPWQGTTLAMHLLRGLSLLMGTGTIIIVYALAREVFPGERWLAVAAAATCAFIPQFLFISGSVSNDNAITLLSTLVLWQLVRLLRRYERPEDQRLPTLQLGTLGIILGLAALSKLSGLALLALAGVVLAWIAWRYRSLAWFIRAAAIVFGLAAVVAGWWYWRNWLLYHNITGLEPMLEVLGRRKNYPQNLGDLWGEFRGLRWSFWGLFGWFSIQLPATIYLILDLFTLLALIGLTIWLIREGRKSKALLPLAMLGLWLAMVFISLVRWTSLIPAMQGRLMFPAISVVVITLVRGLSALHQRRVLVILWCVALLALSIWCPLAIIRPAYARPAAISEEQIPAHLPRLDHDLWNGQIRLLACDITPQLAHPGDMVNITLYWQALEPIAENGLMYIHLLGREWELIGNLDSYPGWGTYPTSLWKPGEILRDRYQVLISPEARAPTLCHVDVGMTTMEQATGEVSGDDSSPVTFEGQIKLIPRQWPAVEGIHTNFRLGDHISLRGYALTKETLVPGDELHLTLYWRAAGPPGKDYTVFVHLLDASGQRISGWDNPPLNGDYPTSLWDEGEVIADEYLIPVPHEAPPGEYTIAVGMYTAETGERLPAYDAEDTRLPHDMVLLKELTIETR